MKNILAFKPIIAMKNDVLYNCGDFIEEAIFIQHGKIAVDIPVDLYQRINKYHEVFNNGLIDFNFNNNNDDMNNNNENNDINNINSSNFNNNINNLKIIIIQVTETALPL